MACSGGCGCDPCTCLELQIPRGNTGATGATGAAGAAGSNGTNGTSILYSDALDVATGAVASPVTLRTFTVTPAMFPTNGQVIEIDTWVQLTTTSVSYIITLQLNFGGTAIAGWLGLPTAGNIHIKTKIYRVSASAQRCTSTILKGVNVLATWQPTEWLIDTTANLAVNNNIEVIAIKSAGNFVANEFISKTILITKYA